MHEERLQDAMKFFLTNSAALCVLICSKIIRIKKNVSENVSAIADSRFYFDMGNVASYSLDNSLASYR